MKSETKATDAASARVFDESLADWKKEQEQPWMTLRYNLEQANINRHVSEQGLRILDAGGGNGHHAIRMAKAGHSVIVLDYAAEMLADGRARAEANGVHNDVRFQQADIDRIPEMFSKPVFDLVLCHNVLQYVHDIPSTLRSITHALRPGGWLSLVFPNRYAEVYKASIRELDLGRTRALLDGEPTRATLFGISMRALTPDELDAPLTAVDCAPVARYGVRCLCDWLPNDPKSDPAFMAQLESLEETLADTFPFYLLARFFQIIARKADPTR